MTDPGAPSGHALGGGRDEEPVRCSARGCQAEAEWGLEWNNPRLHTPDRRKVWTSCAEHRDQLVDFLTARRFLRDVVPVAQAQAR